MPITPRIRHAGALVELRDDSPAGAGATQSTIVAPSSRPERVVGITPLQQFLDGLGFTPDNPPNAAIVAQRERDSSEQDSLVIELLNLVYDAADQTLTYDARVLADYGERGLAYLARQQTDNALAESFGSGSLFIDDCPNATGTCYQIINGERSGVGPINYGQCTDFGRVPICDICGSGTDPRYGKICADTYPDTCHFDNGSFDWFVEVGTIGPPPS